MIVATSGNVSSLAFSDDETTARLIYVGYIGNQVVSGALAGDQLAAIRASAAPEASSESSVAPESSSLVFARMKREKDDNSASVVLFSVTQGRASYASPSTKSVPPSIRRPCNIGR